MSTEQQTVKPATLAEWKKAKQHTITLPSGTVVEVVVPNLPKLVQTGQIPNSLIDIALKVVQGSKQITREDIEAQPDFYNKICAFTVVKPKLGDDDFEDIPYEDKEMLVEIATRQRDLDAVGHHLGGLETVKDWRNFRGLSHVYEDGDSL
jgi:hypothetical protein